MQALTQQRMTADEFIAWSIDRPDGKRYELVDGEIFEMASERYRHALVKARVYRRLFEAAETAGLVCDVFTDGMAVQIDGSTVYEPDAAIRIGPNLDADATRYCDPILVAEILSPSTQGLDASFKLADYFKLPSLRHYLIVRPSRPTVIHHARQDDGTIATRILTSGELTLDPPGLRIGVASLFA